MDRDTDERSSVTESQGVFLDVSCLDVVRSLSTSKVSLVADDCVGGEDWAGLCAYVQVRSSVEVGTFVQEPELGSPTGGGRLKGSAEFQLQSLGELIFELDLRIELVGGGPALCQGESIDLVSPLGFDLSRDGSFLGLLPLGCEVLSNQSRDTLSLLLN